MTVRLVKYQRTCDVKLKSNCHNYTALSGDSKPYITLHITLFHSTDDVAMIYDGRENTRTCNENRKVTMTMMTFVKRRKTSTRDIEARDADCALPYRVIDAPHKHTEQRLVRAEQLNLLVLHPEVLLL